MTTHTDTVCTAYHEPVLPNEQGNCSLCDAELIHRKQEYFVVTRLHREDLAEKLREQEIAQLTDEDMRWIAAKMGEAYCESGAFWDDAESLARIVLQEKE